MGKNDIKLECRIKLDNTPHFKLEGWFSYDSGDQEQKELLEKENSVVMTFRFQCLHLEDGLEKDFKVRCRDESSPAELMRTGMFHALKCYLNNSYEYMDHSGEAGSVYERYPVDTAGFLNHHTYQRILKSRWRRQYLFS